MSNTPTIQERLRDSSHALRLTREAASYIEELERMLGLVDDQRREWERHCKKAEAKLTKAVEALDEAIYLLEPDEEDMAKKAGVYRIVTTFKELKGQDDD